jgi:hypothetical protein
VEVLSVETKPAEVSRAGCGDRLTFVLVLPGREMTASLFSEETRFVAKLLANSPFY